MFTEEMPLVLSSSAHLEMGRIVAEHPDVTFVAAHPGEWENFMRHLEQMEQFDNALAKAIRASFPRLRMRCPYMLPVAF